MDIRNNYGGYAYKKELYPSFYYINNSISSDAKKEVAVLFINYFDYKLNICNTITGQSAFKEARI